MSVAQERTGTLEVALAPATEPARAVIAEQHQRTAG
jgi:hypothetical protein